MNPSVGMIVHYTSHGTPYRSDGTQEYTKECHAAIVTETDIAGMAEDTVALAVLNPTGMFFHPAVPYDGGIGHPGGIPNSCRAYCEGGTWHWPADVLAAFFEETSPEPSEDS